MISKILSGRAAREEPVGEGFALEDPRLYRAGVVTHPDSPAGGGGPGFFREAGPLGDRTDLGNPWPHPFSPAARVLYPLLVQEEVR